MELNYSRLMKILLGSIVACNSLYLCASQKSIRAPHAQQWVCEELPRHAIQIREKIWDRKQIFTPMPESSEITSLQPLHQEAFCVRSSEGELFLYTPREQLTPMNPSSFCFMTKAGRLFRATQKK